MTVHASGPIAGLIVGSLLTAGGWFVAYSIGKPIRDQAAASTEWPTAAGRITRSELTRSRSNGKTMYSADIAYEYEVGDKKLEGGRVWFGDDGSSSDATPWRRAVDRYAAGRAVKVHYDPADPFQSVLEPGVTWSGSILYLIGLGLLAVAGMILFSSLAPLLLMIMALIGISAPKTRDPMDDFARPSPPSRRGSDDGDDDGITIG